MISYCLCKQHASSRNTLAPAQSRAIVDRTPFSDRFSFAVKAAGHDDGFAPARARRSGAPASQPLSTTALRVQCDTSHWNAAFYSLIMCEPNSHLLFDASAST